MIFQAIDAVNRIEPALLPGGRGSVACVWTTNPKYLVFGTSGIRPERVVQFGPEDELRQVHAILTTLEPLLTGIIPAPIACEPWDADTFVQIQTGLDGAPWFILQQRFRTAASWESLEQEALAVLDKFRAAVRSVPEWTSLVVPELELRRQLQLCGRHGVTMSPDTAAGVDRLADGLRSLGSIPGSAQHGDYALNNVLRADDGSMRVMDFEEFGLTRMPLHDEVGLALSMRALGSAPMLPLGLEDHIRRAVKGTIQERPELGPYVRALAVHHMLWRVNRSHGDRRARARQWLLSLVDQLATAPPE